MAKLIAPFLLTVCLQPFVYDPLEKNKHKFMVQSLVATSDLPFEQLVGDDGGDGACGIPIVNTVANIISIRSLSLCLHSGRTSRPIS